MNSFDLRIGGIVAAMLASSFGAAVVHAEEDELSAGLEEVIVSAQKREQRLTDVPISVTAISGSFIEDGDIHDLEGIASRTPSLSFAPFSPGQSIVTLRGASSNDDGAGTDNSVAMFLDDIYLGRGSNINFEMTDLQRVEVLRGPQGTLYGKNALGGAINVVTRKPSIDEAYGSFNLTTGNYDLRLVSAHYSSPVGSSEKWAIKLSGSTRTRDGWVENVLRPNDNLKNQNSQVGRLQVLYQGSRTSVLTSIDVNFLDIDDMGRIPSTGSALASYRTDTGLMEPDRKVASNPVDGFARRNAGGWSIKVDHDLNDQDSLVAIAAGRKSLVDWEMDSAGATVTDLNDNIHDDTDSTQLELRMNFGRSRFNTTVGLWLSTENTVRTEAFDLRIGGTRGEGGTLLTDDYTQDNTTTSLALYGQSEMSFGDSFYLVLGVRATSDSKEIESTSRDGTVIPCAADAAAGCEPNDIAFIINEDFTAKRDEAWLAVTPKLTLGLKLGAERNQNLYLDFSTGFKSGGFAAAPTYLAQTQPLDPETSTAIELGYKGLFRGSSGSVTRLNLAFFTTTYTDLQIQQFGPGIIPDGEDKGQRSAFGFFRTFNATDATLTGFEFEISYSPSNYFTAGLGGHFMSERSYADIAVLRTDGSTEDIPMLGVPELKYFLYLTGDVPTSGGHSFRWSIDYRFEGETRRNINDSTFNNGTDMDTTDDVVTKPVLDEYALLDLRLAWIFPQGFELAAWARNALDESYRTHLYVIGNGIINVYGDPYTWGWTLKYNF